MSSICAKNSQMCISSPELIMKSRLTYLSLDISTWMSTIHLKLNIAKTNNLMSCPNLMPQSLIFSKLNLYFPHCSSQSFLINVNNVDTSLSFTSHIYPIRQIYQPYLHNTYKTQTFFKFRYFVFNFYLPKLFAILEKKTINHMQEMLLK